MKTLPKWFVMVAFSASSNNRDFLNEAGFVIPSLWNWRLSRAVESSTGWRKLFQASSFTPPTNSSWVSRLVLAIDFLSLRGPLAFIERGNVLCFHSTFGNGNNFSWSVPFEFFFFNTLLLSCDFYKLIRSMLRAALFLQKEAGRFWGLSLLWRGDGENQAC